MDEQELRTNRVLRIAEDTLRDRLIATNAEIRADVQVMAQVIREMVDLERSKLPPATGRGYLVLKKGSKGNYSGKGGIGPRKYKARGFQAKDPAGSDVLKVYLFSV